MRAALDTNLLVYAEGFGDEEQVEASRRLLQRLPADRWLVDELLAERREQAQREAAPRKWCWLPVAKPTARFVAGGSGLPEPGAALGPAPGDSAAAVKVEATAHHPNCAVNHPLGLHGWSSLKR